jgi:hypothetical protein
VSTVSIQRPANWRPAGDEAHIEVLVGQRVAVAELGVDLVMLQFQPFETEMRRFAEHVIPRVRNDAPVPVGA